MRRLAANLGRGIVAGAAGAVVMTAGQTIEMRITGRQGSDTPATAAQRLLRIERFESDAARERFSSLVHWGYGTGWGVVRGALGTFVSPVAADAALFAGVWGGEQVIMPALDISEPTVKMGTQAIVMDGGFHALYAVATGLAFRWLAREDA